MVWSLRWWFGCCWLEPWIDGGGGTLTKRKSGREGALGKRWKKKKKKKKNDE